jgi:hypothetical protein
MEKTPIVKFIPDMEKLAGISGIALPWIHEIHIDAKYQNTEMGQSIIEHEMKHYRLAWKRFNEKGKLRKMMLFFYNNLWDFFDIIRIELESWLRRV